MSPNFLYYKLEMLSKAVRAKNKLNDTQSRRDCTRYYATDYKGIEPFMNKKGMFFLSLCQQEDFVNTHKKRMTEFSLTGQGLNFSGLYFEDSVNHYYAYGYPNSNPLLKDGSKNPMFEFRNDLYLFITDSHYLTFEILVFRDCKNLTDSYYQSLINGDFDNEIEWLRDNSKVFYKYE